MNSITKKKKKTRERRNYNRTKYVMKIRYSYEKKYIEKIRNKNERKAKWTKSINMKVINKQK